MNLRNKTVTVIGLGNSGLNAALLLHELGAKVRATEEAENENTRKAKLLLEGKKIPCQTGGHTKEFTEGSELIVVSPGVEEASPPLRWARELNIPVIAEMELGYRFCRGKIIAVTGTNGKSTVTTLIGKILKDALFDTVVCGNIGNSLCGEIGRISADTWVVLEVSSFQLERTELFRPHIAVILNITDDHLDRYAKFKDYFDEKIKIFKNQESGDFLILNKDAGELEGLEKSARSKVLYYSRRSGAANAYLDGNKCIADYGAGKKEFCDIGEVKLKGLHNVENMLASGLAAALAGCGAERIKKAMGQFRSLSHRFETVDVIGGVEYVDDSKGTTVDSTFRALESCGRPVILIAGGKDKRSDYTAVKEIVRKKVRHLILIGEARKRIREALGDATQVHEASDMSGAVSLARALARKEDLVLLSPMCSSFDMFSSYKERGEVFRKAVRGLK